MRLSASRQELSMAEQALGFLPRANSIFSSEKLLTTSDPDFDPIPMLTGRYLPPLRFTPRRRSFETKSVEVR